MMIFWIKLTTIFVKSPNLIFIANPFTSFEESHLKKRKNKKFKRQIYFERYS